MIAYATRPHRPWATPTRTTVLALIADLDIRVINRDTGQLIRALSLNPAKDYQPQPETEQCLETPVNGVPRHHTPRFERTVDRPAAGVVQHLAQNRHLPAAVRRRVGHRQDCREMRVASSMNSTLPSVMAVTSGP